VNQHICTYSKGGQVYFLKLYIYFLSQTLPLVETVTMTVRTYPLN